MRIEASCPKPGLTRRNKDYKIYSSMEVNIHALFFKTMDGQKNKNQHGVKGPGPEQYLGRAPVADY